MIGRILAAPILASLWVYQRTLSPLLGPRCRFEPSCSRYMAGAIRKDGLGRGVGRGLARLARCHPWHPGGFDPP
ncbi:membrane protein insertion efficiency factor YidD [Tundrisphaera sp. TA3]|uniref:membrane protein insertion efficiency factor YidD n=1 Tax=Tundrisphaera sp. TA3 TaxID=3435775 RepID=UPI003EBC2AAF